MKDKISLYEATLVSFDRISKETYNETGSQILSRELEFTNIRTITCVIDENTGNAIDIETGIIYRIIQRNFLGNILKDELEIIQNAPSGELFVYKYHEKDMKNLSLIYQMYIKSRAQKKYQEYLEDIKRLESVKVKTIMKNKIDPKIGK